MFHKATRMGLATVALCYGLGLDTRSKGDLLIKTPTGLTAGDTFRIVFLTDGMTDATSSSISTYNTFVTNDAKTQAGGGANVVKYGGTTLTWTAIASTSTTSAINNIGVTGASVWLIGGEVASSDTTSTGGLWSDGRLLSVIDENLTGSSTSSLVWTGTNADGSSRPSYSLGDLALSQVITGESTNISDAWVASRFTNPNTALPLYGISQVLTVPLTTSVPEPSTLWIACAGMVAAIPYGRRSRKSQ